MILFELNGKRRTEIHCAIEEQGGGRHQFREEERGWWAIPKRLQMFTEKTILVHTDSFSFLFFCFFFFEQKKRLIIIKSQPQSN